MEATSCADNWEPQKLAWELIGSVSEPEPSCAHHNQIYIDTTTKTADAMRRDRLVVNN